MTTKNWLRRTCSLQRPLNAAPIRLGRESTGDDYQLGAWGNFCEGLGDFGEEAVAEIPQADIEWWANVDEGLMDPASTLFATAELPGIAAARLRELGHGLGHYSATVITSAVQ